MSVSVDIDATTTAIDRLASDPDLRHRMGASGAARAREIFDWQVIVRAYERLWGELGDLRKAHDPAAPPSPLESSGFWPARPDPFDLFRSFPTSTLSDQHKVQQAPGLSESVVASRLGMAIVMVNASHDISEAFLIDLWREIGTEEVTVGEVLARRQTRPASLMVRALLWLAKFDLLHIAEPERQA
jgi:hypothetical protein